MNQMFYSNHNFVIFVSLVVALQLNACRESDLIDWQSTQYAFECNLIESLLYCTNIYNCGRRKQCKINKFSIKH